MDTVVTHLPPAPQEMTAVRILSPTPEPATLALAGLGIAGILGARLRRRLRA